MNRLEVFRNKNVLLLQGPVGSFFKNFSTTLQRDFDAKVYKINFCPGDNLFYPDGYNFNGTKQDFHKLLISFFKEANIDFIVLFGDCREYHLSAKEIAKRNNIEVVSFEEGYIRPNYVTMEFNGVNGNSHLAKIKSIKELVSKTEETVINENNPKQYKIALKLYTYNFMNYIFKFQFNKYKHHRSFGLREAGLFVNRWVKRRQTKHIDKKTIDYLSNRDNVFFVPLQVSTDSQIICHSDYSSIEDFIKEVFEKTKNENIVLLFKDHPLEIEKRYKLIIEEIAKNYSTEFYFLKTGNIHDITKFVKGVITINSTVGLQSLFDLKPVFCFGRSIYIKNELAVNENFEDFIRNTEKYIPEKEDVTFFKEYLKNNTQLRGSFY